MCTAVNDKKHDEGRDDGDANGNGKKSEILYPRLGDKGSKYIDTFVGRFDYQKANLYCKSVGGEDKTGTDGDGGGNNVKTMWKCSLCDKKLVSQSGMVTHVQNKHRKELMDIKNRNINNNNNNSDNNNNNSKRKRKKKDRIFIHSSKKDSDILANYKMTDDLYFECKQCGRIIATKSGCMTHLNIHKGIKKFQCSYCPKRFNNRTSWLRHERTHTGEKPFECNICKKRFLQKNTLKSHMATHTKEKNFVCQICNKKYTQSSSLRRHKKKMHK